MPRMMVIHDFLVDEEMIELVEMEVREELSTYGYDGDNIPVICGSALCEIENKNPELGREKILELMSAVDEAVPLPERNPDEPFFMAIESVYQIAGRGTVATGTVERGSAKKGDKVDLVGYGKKTSRLVLHISYVILLLFQTCSLYLVIQFYRWYGNVFENLEQS